MTDREPGDHESDAYVTVLEDVDDETVIVAESVLVDAGIPFIIKGRRAQELVEPGPVDTNFSVPVGPVKLMVRAEDADNARGLLDVEPEVEAFTSEEHVRQLEGSLAAEVIWLGLFLLAGLSLSYLIVPGEWEDDARRLIYIAASVCSVLLGSALLQISMRRAQSLRDGSAAQDERPIGPSPAIKRCLLFGLLALAVLVLLAVYRYGSREETGSGFIHMRDSSGIMNNRQV